MHYFDISKFWPSEGGVPLSVNSVFERFRGTAHQVPYRTLRGAYEGTLDRAQAGTLVNLRAIASRLAGREVSLDEIVMERGDANH